MRRFFQYGGSLRWAALLVFLPVVAQTPVGPPRLGAYYVLPGDTAWSWKSIVVDPPLTLTRDSAGQAHLGLSVPVAPPPTLIDEEVPSGALDGVNAVFTLAQAPNPASSLYLFINGLRMHSGVDFTLTGNTITLTGFIPGANQNMIASYRY